ncbi:MAG TPA: glycoside hydrolase domain-containing protein [Armatimonadota bacterium]|nr:glycoside hydrolase domain-containing protein [Armatimonadota bacterium]
MHGQLRSLAVAAMCAAVLVGSCRGRSGAADGEGATVIYSFETADLQPWQVRQATGEVAGEHATDGQQSLKLAVAGGARGWPGMYLVKDQGWDGADWSAYSALEMDVFNAGTRGVKLYVTLFDTPDRRGGRAKRDFDLEPMRTTRVRVDLGDAAHRGAGMDLRTIGEVAVFVDPPRDPVTLYVDRIALVSMLMRAPDLVLTPRSFSPNGDGWQEQVEIRAELPADMNWELEIIAPDRRQVREFTGTSKSVLVTWDGRDEAGAVVSPGRYEVSLRAIPAGGVERPPRVIARVSVTNDPPPQYLVWSPPVCEKVRRDSPTGQAIGEEGLRVAGARNEQVALQLVISPHGRDLRQVAIEVSDLNGPDGASIRADRVTVLREAYVQVAQPSHRDWEPDLWWPDPLPPWQPCDITADDRHQPAWIEVAVPPGAAAGDYSGQITIRPADLDATVVPLTLTVWDFELSEHPSLDTLFPLYLPSIEGQHLLPGLVADGVGHEGTRCVRFSGEEAREAVLYQMLRPGLAPGRRHVAGAWVRSAGQGSGPTALQVKIVYRDKAVPTDTWEQSLAAGGDWQQLEVGFEPADRERFILVQVMPGAGGEVFVDDVYLRGPNGENLIANGGFEDPRPGRWQLDAPHLPGLSLLHERYFEFLVEHGLTPSEMPVGWEDDAVAAWATQPRISRVRLPFRASWQMGDFPPEDIERLEQAVGVARAGGWLDRTYVYALDEPAEPQYPRVQEVSARVKAIDPGIAFLLTEQLVPALADSVDIWAPLLSRLDMAGLRGWQLEGRVFWWYTAVYPRAPYPTFLVDDYGSAPRVLPWMNARWQIAGLLYWNTTQWRAVSDPWQDPLTLPWAGANGDGSLLYPGSEVGVNGPVASLRLKLIREGLEDHQYLTMLRELVNEGQRAEPKPDGSDPGAARVAEVCGDLFTAPDSYTTDPLALDRARQKVAEEIVRLRSQADPVQ